jgi:D-tyrosyl-tRNA(Tyr) deacylase
VRTYLLPNGNTSWSNGILDFACAQSSYHSIPAAAPLRCFVRIVLQRVKSAHVDVAGETVGSIGVGIAILLGVTQSDDQEDAKYLADKVVQLRIFSDEAGRMNRSLLDAGGSLLVVSQFTLYGDCRKGRRPSFDHAAPPEQARALYEYFIQYLRASNIAVQTGVFQAEMELHIVNDGPVTFILDSNRRVVTT